jgi:dsRNA-specific ribonuclease
MELGIDKCILLPDGMQNPSTYMVATAVEALIGAVYLDGGFERAKEVMGVLGLRYSTAP